MTNGQFTPNESERESDIAFWVLNSFGLRQLSHGVNNTIALLGTQESDIAFVVAFRLV